MSSFFTCAARENCPYAQSLVKEVNEDEQLIA